MSCSSLISATSKKEPEVDQKGDACLCRPPPPNILVAEAEGEVMTRPRPVCQEGIS